MKYIPKELKNEIKSKFDYLINQEKYHPDSECRRIALKRIEKDAQIQSYEIENPYSKFPFSISRNNNKKTIRTGIKNIEQAFIWGVNNFNPENFDESFIREIAGKVYPTLHYNSIAQYRKDNVRIIGASKIPPDAYKIITKEIPWFIENLKNQLKNKEIINRIETAIFAHLHLARIHPFDDGNGRTARVLQDVILTHSNIPSPLVQSGERHIYYTCLDEAVKSWSINNAKNLEDTPSDGEKFFYEFIAGKINSSLDILVKKCSSMKK